MIKKQISIIILLMFLVGIASASFDIGDPSHEIQTQYSSEDTISGWVNLSFDNEKVSTLFETNFQNTISLVELLGLRDDYEYECEPSDCKTKYTATNQQETKSFILNNKDSKLIGLKFTGQVSSIDSISFNIKSTAQSSCLNQIELDFLDDKIIDSENNKTSEETCSKSYGCFKTQSSIEEISIDDSPYCQKITFPKAPGFKVGAWVKKVSGERVLTIELYNKDGQSTNLGCDLPEASTEGGEIFCEINHPLIKEKYYYACIYSNSGTGNYNIRKNSNPQSTCGFHYLTTFGANKISAYQIFVDSKKYNNVGNLTISNYLPTGESLGSKAFNYILRYGEGSNIDCSNGCVVPIRINSKTNQEIEISNLQTRYTKDFDSVTSYKDFYDLNEEEALVTAGFQKLYLDKANFSISGDYGESVFELEYDNQEILSQDIVFEKIPTISGIMPSLTVAVLPTEFLVDVDSDYNITEYKWDFGDNSSTITTTKNTATHSYEKIGNYLLTLEITDFAGLSTTKSFTIGVGSPEQTANETLAKKLYNLEQVKKEIQSLSEFKQENLEKVLNLTENEKQLSLLQKDFGTANSADDFIKVMKGLLNLKIPETIKTTQTANDLTFYPVESVIDLEILKEIGGGSYDTSKQDSYLQAIYAWNKEYLDTKISFEELSAKYGGVVEPVLKTFEFKITQKKKPQAYIIIKKLADLEFDGETEQEKNNYVYFDLTEDKTLKFSISEDIEFTEIPLFISPRLSKLTIPKEQIGTEKEKSIIMPTLLILLVILLGVAGYVALQVWYKKKYEDYLFKNKNELFNLFSYINNAKKQGKDPSHIEQKLKKAKWNSEQVDYAMKKYSGKRTGMLEIPIEKILNFFRKRQATKTSLKKQKPISRPNIRRPIR